MTGHDRAHVSLLAWINAEAARRVLPASVDLGDAAAICACPEVRAHVRDGLATYNAAHPGSSERVARVLLLAAPPSLDAGEITDKGYINQRAVLDRRRDEVERLYAPDRDPAVIELMAAGTV